MLWCIAICNDSLWALKAVRVQCFLYGYVIAKCRNNYMPCFIFYPKIRLLFIENRLLYKIRKSTALERLPSLPMCWKKYFNEDGMCLTLNEPTGSEDISRCNC